MTAGSVTIPAQSPSELTCSGKHHPISAPFLASPYAGWTEVASFLDHDLPDYTVDGKVVIANGLTASAGDGQGSDFFPSYWSRRLRQFISYDGHNGYDLDISYQPVYAAAAGTVKFSGWNDSDPYAGYGQMVLINHHNGYVTLYGHLSKLEVKTGDAVTAGEEIGISGTTGNSSGPHLHFTVFHDCHVSDPFGWTGAGPDPLRAFNGEQSSYLWLPGHDPLLLNPPPDWPSYPSGIALAEPGQILTSPSYLHGPPPADRLLLLALPGPEAGHGLSPGVALSRTEAVLTEEGETVAPLLSELKAQGLIDGFEIVPAAAAIWIRGTVTADELENLPGVASLTGVEPHDLAAAESGLAHAVLIQIGEERAPALWPVGFRSGLHAWRPVVTALVGQPLVAGLALPGKHVVVSLQRGNSVRADAATTADSTSGGFVAALQDGSGTAVRLRAGDIVQLECAGRVARVSVGSMSIRARATTIAGSAPPRTALSLAIEAGSGRTAGQLAASSSSGAFSLRVRNHLSPGTLVVASMTDAAGNQESASGYVPGIEVDEGGSFVRGWTVGRAPRLSVVRAGRVLIRVDLQPAADGTFAIDLKQHSLPMRLRAGDVVIVGSVLHHRSIALPRLSAALRISAAGIRLVGPSGSLIRLNYQRGVDHTWVRDVVLDASGHAGVAAPYGRIAAGDKLLLRYLAPDGSSIEWVSEAREVTVHLGEAEIVGRVTPAELLSLRLIDRGGHTIGSAIAGSSERDGTFRAMLGGREGSPISVNAGDGLVFAEAASVVTARIPSISAGTSVGIRTPKPVRFSSNAGVFKVYPPATIRSAASRCASRRVIAKSQRSRPATACQGAGPAAR